MTTDPTTPSAVQQHSTFKPRLLYRGPLRLADGTLLPGVAFVSTVSPFDSSPSSSEDKGDNYDAEICLALEMVRGQRVVGIDLLDHAVAGGATGKGVGGAGSSRQKVDGREVDVTIEATGRVKMYIDPREQATAAFFERHFCWREDWSKIDRVQSRHVFTLSTAPTSHDFQSSDSQSQDPFVSSYSQGFGPPAVVDGKALQLVLFARLADGTQTLEDGSRGLDIVVGRRLVKRRKARQALAKQPRPDDPLPRAAALADLMLSQRGGPPPRSSSPADLPLPARSHASKWVRTPSLGAPPLSAGDVLREQSQGSAALVTESAPRARSAGGNHTPGRRGEKRHKAATAVGTDVGLQGPGSPSQMLASPSKRRRADEVDLTTISKRRMERTSSSASGAALAHKSNSLRLPSLTVSSHKSRRVTPSSSAAVTPEMPDSAVFSSFDEADESSVSRNDGVKPIERAPSKTSASGLGTSSSSSSAYSPLETRNRGTIKKLVQHQLLGRGLERGDEDFERCFTAAYHGTALALRHTISSTAVERQQAAQLVACHLGMYLPAPAPAPPPPPILAPNTGVVVNPGESQAQALSYGYSSRGVKLEMKEDEGSDDEEKKPMRDAVSPF